MVPAGVPKKTTASGLLRLAPNQLHPWLTKPDPQQLYIDKQVRLVMKHAPLSPELPSPSFGFSQQSQCPRRAGSPTGARKTSRVPSVEEKHPHPPPWMGPADHLTAPSQNGRGPQA